MNAFHTAELAKLRHLSPEDEIRDTYFSYRFDTAYAPVISVNTGKILGFRTSERIWAYRYRRPILGRFPTNRHHPLLSLQDKLELKRQQILHAPDQGWCMLDLDPGSFFAADAAPRNAFLQLLERYAWSEREIIVNLTGRHKGTGLQAMADRLQQAGVEIALDAAGLHRGLFSLGAFLDATIVKFDCGALGAEPDASDLATKALLGVARDIGVQTIMTGVDQREHYDWARSMGVDAVLGRLFRSSGMRNQ